MWAGLRRRPQPDSAKGCRTRVQHSLSSFPSRYPPPPFSAGRQADHASPGGPQAVRGLVALRVHAQFSLWSFFQVEGTWGRLQNPTTASPLRLSGTSSPVTPVNDFLPRYTYK